MSLTLNTLHRMQNAQGSVQDESLLISVNPKVLLMCDRFRFKNTLRVLQLKNAQLSLRIERSGMKQSQSP
jgi:hypothetical protein